MGVDTSTERAMRHCYPGQETPPTFADFKERKAAIAEANRFADQLRAASGRSSLTLEEAAEVAAFAYDALHRRTSSTLDERNRSC